ncbi:jg19742 [Pararge aegeria aegeria]|uniref:Jg19742 protein n=1 Tax=Pararge aegeria aegeria TaxID=348720 RepID=A0A8S4RSX5_9NEOP|nr:jg19742 [Pararge aegeria aegeria]
MFTGWNLLVCLGRFFLMRWHAKRPVGRPRLRFKDCAKRDMFEFKMDHRHWERLAEGRDEWRKSINEGCHIYDEAWLGVLAQKSIRTPRTIGIPRDLQVAPKGLTAISAADVNVARASVYLTIQRSLA